MKKEKEIKEEKRVTNRRYLETDRQFVDACNEANIKRSLRQASKFRRGIGAAYKITVKKLKDIHIPEKARKDK